MEHVESGRRERMGSQVRGIMPNPSGSVADGWQLSACGRALSDSRAGFPSGRAPFVNPVGSTSPIAACISSAGSRMINPLQRIPVTASLVADFAHPRGSAADGDSRPTGASDNRCGACGMNSADKAPNWLSSTHEPRSRIRRATAGAAVSTADRRKNARAAVRLRRARGEDFNQGQESRSTAGGGASGVLRRRGPIPSSRQGPAR